MKSGRGRDGKIDPGVADHTESGKDAAPPRTAGSMRADVLFVADDAFEPMSEAEVAAMLTGPLFPERE